MSLDLAFDDGDEALRSAQQRAREARTFRDKEAGHVSCQTFSFNTSQLKIDTNELFNDTQLTLLQIQVGYSW